VEVGERIMFVKFVATNTQTAESVQHVIGKDFAMLESRDILLVLGEDVKLEDISQ
jgi:hypothetical protein